MLQTNENNLIVSLLPSGRTLSYFQREAPVPHYPTAEDGMPSVQLTHRYVFEQFKKICDEQRARHRTCAIPDTSFAAYIGAPLDQVREILGDLAEAGKLHRTSVDRRTGASNFSLGSGW